MTLMRWDPWRELESMRRNLDRFFESDFWPRSERTGAAPLPVDVVEEGDNYVIKASLPGFTPDDVNISVAGRSVTIHAEAKKEEEKREGQEIVRERFSGTMTRSLMLPSELNADQANAEYRNGVLTLTLPKAEVERAKRIPIKAAEG